MTVRIKEQLMAAGDWSVELDWSPSAYDRLHDRTAKRARLLHARFFDADNNLLYVGILRRVTGDENGLTIGGPGPLWHLGVLGGPGPTVVDRKYLSHANKLANPLFVLDPDDLYWVTGDTWVIAGGWATVTGAPLTDQPLVSNEKFGVDEGAEYTGAEYTSTVLIRRPSGSVGRLRLRHVYSGTFEHPDLFPAFSGWAASVGTNRGQHDLTVTSIGGADVVLAAPAAMPNIIPNGSFDDGGGSLNGFIQIAGTWSLASDGGHNGAHYMHTDGGPAWKEIVSSADGAVILPAIAQGVFPGEEFQMWMVARTNPSEPATDGTTHMMAGLTGSGTATFVGQDQALSPDNGTGNWQLARTTIRIPDDGSVNGLTPQIVVDGQTTGRWDFDDVTLIRTKGNVDQITGPSFPITPGLAYRWSQPVLAAEGWNGGEVSMAVVCFTALRDPVVIQGPNIQPTKGAAQVQEWEFTPPSGVDVAYPRFVSRDVAGGAVVLGRGTIRQSDASVSIVDVISPATVTGDFLHGFITTAPAGARDIHLELVAEAYAGGWEATGFTLARTDGTAATGNAIVADLLTQPETGAPLSVAAGTVNCPEVIPYDWRLRNLTDRDALDHYCNVVSAPPREYRVNPGDPPTIDVGTAEDVFTDHLPSGVAPIVLRPVDRDVESLTNPESDVTERATHVKVIGADRQTVTGRPIPIEATAAVPGTAELDYNGRPVVRLKTTTAGTVDHFGYAQALAAAAALSEAEPPLALTGKVSGLGTRPAFVTGDWLYAYHPEGGLDGDYPTIVEGEPVMARRVRVLEMERVLGPSHRIEMREADGSTWPLPDVTWSDEDATVLTIGDRIPQWVADPQGGAEGKQYIDDRRSAPR